MSQAGISKADLALVFFTAEHAKHPDDLTRTISRVIGTDCVVGSSAVGVLTGAGEIEGSGGIAVLVVKADEIIGRPFIFEPLKGNEVNLGTTMGDFVAKTRDERSLMLLLPDTYNGNPQPLLDSMAVRAGFHPVVGAGSSEGSGSGPTHQLCGDKIVSNAIAGAYLSGEFDLHIDITQGCQPITAPLTITKAERNLIHEIDGKPALEVFAGLLKGPLAEDLRRALMVLFVGLPADRGDNSVAAGKYLVRNIIGLDPKKGVVGVAQEVHDGEAMIFAMRDGQRAREDLNQMLGRQAARLGDKKTAFGLYFNCCARGTSLYGIPELTPRTFARRSVICL